MIENVNDPRFDEIAEAKKQGHKFMKIYLHPSKVGRGQNEISIGGAIVLRGFRKGGFNPEDEEFTFQPEKDANMVFVRDRNEREHICWLYDDQGKGYFTDTGYNRDMLATHWGQNYFIIKDPEVYADVKKRYEGLKANPPERENKKDNYNPQGRVTPENSIKDLDSEIAFLEGRKKQIEQVQEKEKQDEAKLEKAYQEIKDDPDKQPPPVAKKGPGRPRVNKEPVPAT